jgi:hypothetical protein
MLYEFYCITSNSARNWHIQEYVATLEQRDGMIRWSQKHVKSGDLFTWLMFLQKDYTCYIYNQETFLICIFTNLIAHNKNMHMQIWHASTCINKFVTTETMCFQVHPPKLLPCSDQILWSIKHEHTNKTWTTMFKNIYLNQILVDCINISYDFGVILF